MKFLLFAGSLRKASLNRKLLAVAAELIKKSNIDVHIQDLTVLSFPVYSDDIEQKGIPEGVKTLAKVVTEADAIVISSPEYNGGMSGVLKNTLDWVSRVPPMPWKGKPLLLLAASPGALGGTRGLWHGRVPFEVTGALVYPEMFGLPKADQAFDDAGNLKDPKTQERLNGLLENFATFARNNVARTK
jgi:chromate reductase